MAPELKQNKPAYVRFERRPIEDRTASIRNGHYTTVDVDYAIITPFGSKDQIIRVVKDWFAYLTQQVQEERLPIEWVEMYQRAYERWQKGEELPVEGTPVKGWPLLSPAQQSNLVAVGVITVEQLSELNESAKALIGLGAMDMQRKAKNWLEQANNAGKVVSRLTALEQQMTDLANLNKAQGELISKLRAENETLKSPLAAKVAA